MRAGALDRRITLQRRDTGVDAFGGEDGSWLEIANVWAAIGYDRGDERFAVQELVGQAVVVFRIRWSRQVSSLTTKDRVVFDGRVFDIRDVREIGRREGLEIDATVRNEDAVA